MKPQQKYIMYIKLCKYVNNFNNKKAILNNYRSNISGNYFMECYYTTIFSSIYKKTSRNIESKTNLFINFSMQIMASSPVSTVNQLIFAFLWTYYLQNDVSAMNPSKSQVSLQSKAVVVFFVSLFTHIK